MKAGLRQSVWSFADGSLQLDETLKRVLVASEDFGAEFAHEAAADALRRQRATYVVTAIIVSPQVTIGSLQVSIGPVVRLWIDNTHYRPCGETVRAKISAP
jgi:hypothetical protein